MKKFIDWLFSEKPVQPETLNERARNIHAANKAKGFWDEPRETGTLLMLVTSELAEALEADRAGAYADIVAFHEAISEEELPCFKTAFENNIKDTFEDEIADAMIRLFDIAGARGMDLEEHIFLKLKYNSLRPHKHGKKY